MDINEILSKVDHTLLSQTATWDEIKAVCDDGMKYRTASVCIPASFVKRAKEYVGEALKICTVIGFPNGYSTTAAKVFETADAVENGADEIDMVINIGTGGQMAYIDNGVKFGDYETRPFFAGRTTRAGTQLPSGRQLNTLIEFITDIGNEIFGAETDKETAWNYVDGLNDRPGDTEGLKLDFGFFDSDGGSISGISGSNLTVRKFFHAVYDSMSEAYYQKSRVLTDAGDKVSGKIICTGGVVRKNRVLLDFFADKFGMNCAMAPYVEDSMMGLLRFMRWCVYDEKLM